MKLRILMAAAAATTLLASCGDDGTGPENGPGPENQAPQFAAIADLTITVGQTREVSISATDADGDHLTFSIPTNPGFVQIRDVVQDGNTATATLVFAPTAGNLGTHTATLRVSDGKGGVDDDECGITVQRAAITSGWWGAQTGFGQLIFYASSQSTVITEVNYIFEDYTCGAATASGSAKFTGNWPVTDGQFTIQNEDPSGLAEATISGSFDPMGDEVSGDWEVVFFGSTCSGTWRGEPTEVTTVTGTLRLPAEAPGRPYAVFVDDDLDADNGYVAAAMGVAGTGSTVSYSMVPVPAGDYILYAVVCVASDCSAAAEDGDYVGAYGTPLTAALSPSSGPVGTKVELAVEAAPNIAVPASGSLVYDIDLVVMDYSAISLTVGDVSATAFIESIDFPLAVAHAPKIGLSRSVAQSLGSVFFMMPNAGGAGAYSVNATFFNVVSMNPVTWTQEGDVDPTEPDNDETATAPDIVYPFDFVGSFLNGDYDDFYWFELATDESVVIELNWNNDKDLDFYVYIYDPVDGWILECGAYSPSDRPETAVCSLPAGRHVLWVNDWDAYDANDYSLVSYRVTGNASDGSQVAGFVATDPCAPSFLPKLMRLPNKHGRRCGSR